MPPGKTETSTENVIVEVLQSDAPKVKWSLELWSNAFMPNRMLRVRISNERMESRIEIVSVQSQKWWFAGRRMDIEDCGHFLIVKSIDSKTMDPERLVSWLMAA